MTFFYKVTLIQKQYKDRVKIKFKKYCGYNGFKFINISRAYFIQLIRFLYVNLILMFVGNLMKSLMY